MSEFNTTTSDEVLTYLWLNPLYLTEIDQKNWRKWRFSCQKLQIYKNLLHHYFYLWNISFHFYHLVNPFSDFCYSGCSCFLFGKTQVSEVILNYFENLLFFLPPSTLISSLPFFLIAIAARDRINVALSNR